MTSKTIPDYHWTQDLEDLLAYWGTRASGEVDKGDPPLSDGDVREAQGRSDVLRRIEANSCEDDFSSGRPCGHALERLRAALDWPYATFEPEKPKGALSRWFDLGNTWWVRYHVDPKDEKKELREAANWREGGEEFVVWGLDGESLGVGHAEKSKVNEILEVAGYVDFDEYTVAVEEAQVAR